MKSLMAQDKVFEYMAYAEEPHRWILADVERDFVRSAGAFMVRHMEALVR